MQSNADVFRTRTLAHSFIRLLICLSVSMVAWTEPLFAQTNPAKNLKVYVMVGMHVDFYHSWRGDTPDDAGWGYDVKIIRSSIQKLNAAKAKGLKAKAYWDFSANNWTFGEFLPKHFPEMIPLLQTRDGIDEFVAGPFNNGLNSAGTKKEFLKAIEWTYSNPDGYGLKQLFKNVGKSYRPQEMYHASHQNRWLKEAGVENLILFYAACAFDTFAPFIAPLSWEDRLNPITMKTSETDEPITVLPAMSTIDLVNYVSLENLMIDLRKKQMNGEIKRNVVVHLNMDADALSWEPLVSNRTIQSVVPNTGGLQEIIDAVNKYKWADFTTPAEYLQIEKPQKTIFLRQDTADGSFDGMASWAEKASTGDAWSKIERSRVIDRLLDSKIPGRADRDAWSDEGFKDRVLALSTTHYGMATPLIHRERAARLDRYTNGSLTDRNFELGTWLKSQTAFQTETRLPELFFFEYPRFGETGIAAHTRLTSVQHQSFTVPKSVKGGPAGLSFIRRAVDDLTDVIETYRTEKLPASQRYAWSEEIKTLCEPTEASRLTGANGLAVEFTAASGIQSLQFEGQSFGRNDFFSPFVSWKQKVPMSKGLKTSLRATRIAPDSYQISSQGCETAADIRETHVKGLFSLKAPNIEQKIEANYRFWTQRELPYLFADVSAFIPVTADDTAKQNVDRRYMAHVDYRLQELALAQLKPDFGNSSEIKVWKMNYEGEVSSYEFNYEKFNPKNLNLDSVNNHITPGWVAVSNGQKGLLIAFQTTKRAGFGAVPMRVRDRQGAKDVYLNPFGTYFGKQFDYSHVGGEKLGTVLANLGGVFVRPNAPSYSGRALHFELMIAPYLGDAPSKELISAALDFAYPATGLLKSQAGIEDDFQAEKTSFEAITHAREKALFGQAVTTPVGLGVAPTDRGIRVSWKSTNPKAVDEYEVGYRKKGYFKSWTFLRTQQTELAISGLMNDRLYEVTVRAVKRGQTDRPEVKSALAKTQLVTPSANVKDTFVNEIAPTPKLIWMFLDGIIKHAKVEDPDL